MVEEMVLEKQQIQSVNARLTDLINSIFGMYADEKGIARIPKVELAKGAGYRFQSVETLKNGSLKISGFWEKEE
jgi:hypothetical protein